MTMAIWESLNLFSLVRRQLQEKFCFNMFAFLVPNAVICDKAKFIRRSVSIIWKLLPRGIYNMQPARKLKQTFFFLLIRTPGTMYLGNYIQWSALKLHSIGRYILEIVPVNFKKQSKKSNICNNNVKRKIQTFSAFVQGSQVKFAQCF